ncbi:MAG: GNAT family N-acetyltransferase [Bacteroidetes bacterium]|nr:GNAT family N-acetyltransferase [Bacteroidota bacterium]
MKVLIFKANSNQLEIALAIRRKVFVEEQFVSEELEFDGLDDVSETYLLFIDDKAIATTRLRPTDKGLKIERFAVLQDYRNKGFGRMLLLFILKEISDFGKLIYLNAQEQVVEFYKNYGFEICSNRFIEAGIPHFQMQYKKN